PLPRGGDISQSAGSGRLARAWTRDSSVAWPSRPRLNRRFIVADQPEAPPTHCGEPGARGDHGRSRRLRGNRSSPTAEPAGGRTRIKTTESWHVFAPVLEHVDESIPDFARGLERPHVVTIAPDSSAAAEDPVHRLRESDREALDAPG